MKKVCKYAIAAIVIAFLVYHSIYFENLEDIKQQKQREAFNAAQYARDFWDNRLFSVLDQAVDIQELIELFSTNMNEAVRRYGKAPGVSRTYAYLIKGEGKILSITEDFLQVSISEPETNPDVKISTGFYIPGNAVRDASGLVDVSNFTDTMKFNEISSEINKIVVKDVIRPFLDKRPQVGSTMRFFGAIQVSQEAIEAKEIQLFDVVPIRLESK
jgi:predicted lipoprotein